VGCIDRLSLSQASLSRERLRVCPCIASSRARPSQISLGYLYPSSPLTQLMAIKRSRSLQVNVQSDSTVRFHTCHGNNAEVVFSAVNGFMDGEVLGGICPEGFVIYLLRNGNTCLWWNLAEAKLVYELSQGLVSFVK